MCAGWQAAPATDAKAKATPSFRAGPTPSAAGPHQGSPSASTKPAAAQQPQQPQQEPTGPAGPPAAAAAPIADATATTAAPAAQPPGGLKERKRITPEPVAAALAGGGQQAAGEGGASTAKRKRIVPEAVGPAPAVVGDSQVAPPLPAALRLAPLVQLAIWQGC